MRARQNVAGGLEVGFCLSRARIPLSSPFGSASRQRSFPQPSSQGYPVDNLYPNLVLIADFLAETPLTSYHRHGLKKANSYKRVLRVSFE